jgi:hypothetical protein
MIFSDALLANRSRFNAKFAEARHYHPKLNGEQFAELLRTLVAPIVESVNIVQPTSTQAVTEVLYDLALDLLAQDFLGSHSRYPIITAGWAQLLPKLARFIAIEPRSVVGAITNALYNLSLTPGTRPNEWTQSLSAVADLCPDVKTLLTVGQILSWKAGLAHYRAAALDLLRTLSPELACLILALPPDKTQTLDSVLSRLASSPWQTLEPPPPTPNSQLRIIKRVGAFRGFGGLFITPPLVFLAEHGFIVTDGEGTWLLNADCYGATFHRTAQSSPIPQPDSPFKLSRTGKVTVNKTGADFPQLAQSSSSAANEHTLAVTVPYSHAIYLVALT